MMQSFCDNEGRRWNVSINVSTVRRVRERTGFEFGSCLQDDGEVFFSMLNNMEMLTDVLFHVCSGQCKDAGVNMEQFADAFDGEVFDQAGPALQRAFAFFCPNPFRQVLLNMMEIQATVTDDTAKEEVETTISPASKSAPKSELSQDLTPSVS